MCQWDAVWQPPHRYAFCPKHEKSKSPGAARSSPEQEAGAEAASPATPALPPTADVREAKVEAATDAAPSAVGAGTLSTPSEGGPGPPEADSSMSSEAPTKGGHLEVLLPGQAQGNDERVKALLVASSAPALVALCKQVL